MADVHDKTTRSFNMSKIRGKNTKPEILVRKFLFSKGFRFRLHVNELPGKPDIVLPKFKVVIFINGCFWHGHHGCMYFVVPKTRTIWWLDKINATIAKDVINCKMLTDCGWKVITIWECELKSLKRNNTLSGLIALLY